MIKPLKLTQKHKDKLLEMCRKLFPEYNDKIFIDDGGFVTDFHLSEPNTYIQSINIHWFEFCMTYLVREICTLATNDECGFEPYGFDKMMKKSILKCTMYDEPKHPVNYLYKEFLKLEDDKKTA